MDLKIKTETEEFHGRTCGIIKQENKFLIMRVNKTSYFHIPGGHIEIGEDSKEAIIREIKEEIGCDVQEANLFVIQENFWIRNNRKCHGIEFYYIIGKRNFKNAVNELWPIPQSERNINPNLTQNNGY